jgi:histidinol-phosphate aminotransferase
MTKKQEHVYEKAVTPSTGLRLHLNENTAGCSPKVLEALHAITRQQAAFYPDYEGARAAAARRLGVGPDELVLTNGLDEGILAAAVSALRPRGHAAGFASPDPEAIPPGSDPEGIVVVPAFDMYAACIDAAGGQVVTVPLNADFSFPLSQLLNAIGPNTRLIFLTNPNNPTGQCIPRAEILDVVRAAPHALVFVDEAYADFAGLTLIDDVEARAFRNLVIGRTFAKAYGLAGLRAGAVVGHPETLAPLGRVIPPYSLNIYAATALTAGLGDADYYEWYLDQVRESKSLVYSALERLGLRYWPSAANFVLVELGTDTGRVIDALAARQVFVRDRSRDHACAGCVRVTTGVVAHTRTFVNALEEVLCGAA